MKELMEQTDELLMEAVTAGAFGSVASAGKKEKKNDKRIRSKKEKEA